MSRHQKALVRLCTVPPPADLHWSDLKALLEHLGYEMLKNSGSRRKFFHAERKALVICHEPHPSPVVAKGCVAGIVEHLRAHGFIED